MSESTEPHPEKERKWPGRLLKAAFFLIAFALIIMTVMSNMGGSSDTLKSAIAESIAQSSGYATRIETLNRMSFFPRIEVDIEGVEMRRIQESDPSIAIERADISMNFFDAIFHTGRIKNFSIEGLSALPDSLLPQSLYIERARINDEQGEGDAALLEATGQIGETTLNFQADMKAFGKKGSRSYAFPTPKTFTLAIGDLGFQGTVWFSDKTLKIENLRARMPEKIFDGTLEFSKTGPRVFHVAGVLQANDQTVLSPDLTLDRGAQSSALTGEIASPVFYAADFAHGGSMERFSQKLMIALGRGGESLWALPGADISVAFKTDKLMAQKEEKGPLQTTIVYKNGALDLGALQPVLAAEPTPEPPARLFGPFLQDAQ